MQCYTEIVPPSGVTHSLAASFTSANGNNLIVVRTSVLQIFCLKQSDNRQETKLVLVAEYRLSGTVTAIGKAQIQNSKSGGEAILLAFRDAKVSLIEWDPSQHGIYTISIHYYEDYASQTAPWTPDLRDCISRLTVDPNSRCAAFNFGVSNLAIIPFHHTGDDLAMDDIDVMDGGALDRVPTKQTNGDVEHSKPYFPSFVLPLTALDPALLHPVDMAFLHEYRDPTIGVIYSTAARSNNMNFERKDVTIYSVYALDVEGRASTTLQSVPNLPNDVFAIVALPLPVGGALLIGGNELVHIDQGGKPMGIAVNEFARDASSFPMADHANLRMRLEGCQIQTLQNATGEMLVVLKSGDLAMLTFRLDGRSVSGMSLKTLDDKATKDLIKANATCAVALGSGMLFVGSEAADSVLLGSGRRQSQLKRSTSKMQSATNGHVSEEDDAHSGGSDDDDLYANIAAEKTKSEAANSSNIGLNVRLLDTLPSTAPIHDITVGRSFKRKRDVRDEGERESESRGLELAASCGKGRAGGISFFSPNLALPSTHRIRQGGGLRAWSFQTAQDADSDTQHVILSETSSDGAVQSSLWTLDDNKLEPKQGTDFESSTGSTLAVCSLSKSNHVAHVAANEIRVYDEDFGLSQIFPIVDEEENQTARAVRASFVEPFLIILKDDQSLILLKADSKGELEELDLPEPLARHKFSSASLFFDEQDFFQASRFQSKAILPNILLLLLTKEGVASLLPMVNPRVQIFQAEGLHFLPTSLAANVPVPKHWKYKDELADVLITDIGDKVARQPYLIIRNTTGDVIIYEPYALPEVLGSFQFKKIASRNADYNPDADINEAGETTAEPLPIEILNDIGGFSAVFIPGNSPRLILKRASTAPQIYQVSDVKSICAVQTSNHDFLIIRGSGDLHSGSMPSDVLVGSSDWMVKKVDLGMDVIGLTYFEAAEAYVLGTDYFASFELPRDDEWHTEWAREKTQFLPNNLQSSLQLMSGKTHRLLDEYSFGEDERILCIKTMNLEVSEVTHERKDLIVVGTAVSKGENVVERGYIYLFDVADVVPIPNKPESGLRLKQLTKEDVRGAVTSICPIGSQGFVLASQGQKCMVRGLREDMSILPVAFMDMRYYVHVAKSLASTGLTILGDAFSGLWLMGYSEEPYKMQLLGRDLENPDCLAADFLPAGKELHIISSDADGQLRILQYDPENPKSERGAKLLLRSTFDTGSCPTTMTLLPRTPTSYELASQSTADSEDAMAIDAPAMVQQQLLISTQGGSLALMVPVSEATYRRLSTLQNILLTQLEHPCSLNPRAYRAVETDGIGGRGVIDGDLVKRWLELSSHHKASVADKVGARGVWEVRSDLEMILGSSGLAYLS